MMACEVLLFQGCGPRQRLRDESTNPRALNRDRLSWLSASAVREGALGHFCT